MANRADILTQEQTDSPAARRVWAVSAATRAGHYDEAPGQAVSAQEIDQLRQREGDQAHKLRYHFCCAMCPNDVTYDHHRTGARQYRDGTHSITTHWAVRAGSLHTNRECKLFHENYEHDKMLTRANTRWVWSLKALTEGEPLMPSEVLGVLKDHYEGSHSPRNQRISYISAQELETFIGAKGGISSPYFDHVDIAHMGRKRPAREVVFDPADMQAFIDMAISKPGNFYYVAVQPKRGAIREVFGRQHEIECYETQIEYRGKKYLFKPVIETDDQTVINGFYKGYFVKTPVRVMFKVSDYYGVAQRFDDQIRRNPGGPLSLTAHVRELADIPAARMARLSPAPGQTPQLGLFADELTKA